MQALGERLNNFEGIAAVFENVRNRPEFKFITRDWKKQNPGAGIKGIIATAKKQLPGVEKRFDSLRCPRYAQGREEQSRIVEQRF